MAKQSIIQREKKKHKLVNKYFQKRIELKLKLKKVNSLEEIFLIQKDLQNLPRNSLPIRIKNRCWKTGRSRGVYRDFGLSRHVIRELANKSYLPGIVKASW